MVKGDWLLSVTRFKTGQTVTGHVAINLWINVASVTCCNPDRNHK